MELAAAAAADLTGSLIMAAITAVFTIARVAQMLGEDEDWLHEISIELEPEDGCISIWGTAEDADGSTGFTASGIENLKDLIREHRHQGKAPPKSRTPPSVA